MSVIESLAQARRERLQRIAARAVAPAAAAARPRPDEAAVPVRPRNPPDGDYERAWAAVILGIAGVDRLARRPRIADILRATARQFAITPDEMLTGGLSRSLSRPRHVAMYLAKQLTTKTFAEIGRACGGRDHTTVLHAVNGITARIESDAELAHHIACIRGELEETYSCKGEDQS